MPDKDIDAKQEEVQETAKEETIKKDARYETEPFDEDAVFAGEESFGEMMTRQMAENSTDTTEEGLNLNDEKLRDLSKTLPAWSIEPPFKFLD